MDDLHVNKTPDIKIVQRMQYENSEKFKTLVRMHLSFELDLNTDEFDLPCHEVVYVEKGKIKKWNRLSKKAKNPTAVRASSSPVEGTASQLTSVFVQQMRKLKQFLMQDANITQEGIFRKAGSVSRQNELRVIITSHKPIELDEGYTAHDCATVYKGFLSELHEPLLTDAHYPAHCQIADLCNGLDKNSTDHKKEKHLLNSVQLLLLLLPEENRILLEDIIEMLHAVIQHESINKMTADNLATLFAPHLICPRDLPPEALHYISQTMSSVVSYMITKGSVIFEIPAKLATDIRADFFERKRKQTMSPEQMLDESISDMSTVNTVYTFVDREKTAAALNSNNTDTELAQLYAHIQSMPESSKKRRLIKQFNKQNGQGTPLQLLNTKSKKAPDPIRSAKSIGDSIKKHIFHKTLISKTPKQGPSTSHHLFATPNGTTKNPMLRVLFQSPISTSSTSCSSNASSTPSAKSSSSAIKSHPLQKSISSSSLVLKSSKSAVSLFEDSDASNSPKTVSAPVSRTSSDLDHPQATAPMNMLASAAKQLMKNATEKKNVGWNDENLYSCEPCTPVKRENAGTPLSSSKYKSEPNLSRILTDKNCDEHTPINHKITKSITRKLIKGVSMGNLKFSFTPDSSKRLGRSSSMKTISALTAANEPEIEADSSDVVNTTEESDGDLNYSDVDVIEDDTVEIHNSPQVPMYRNIDLITSTPSMLFGRRSMSPITKSTQRMPKAMQESIMTPRSRKPVMLTTVLGLSEQNQSNYQSDLLSFREQDEDSFLCQNVSAEANEPIQYEPQGPIEELKEVPGLPETLTDPFKEYLLSRSVLNASPVDSSTSSNHEDDSEGSLHEIENLNEDKLSPSLLYCLDGNEPDDVENATATICDNDNEDETHSDHCSNNRKRSAPSHSANSSCDSIDKVALTNSYTGDYMKAKKLSLVIRESADETSF